MSSEPENHLEQYDYDEPEETCWNCSGEGFVSSCFEEWACVDPESGCDLCISRCDVCRARAHQETSNDG